MIDTVKRALYDEYAEWYDENIAPFGLAVDQQQLAALDSTRVLDLDDNEMAELAGRIRQAIDGGA